MSNTWQELLPVDRYTVSSTGLLNDYDRKVMTLLYQPLIGPICTSLYMTLWSELEENRLWSQSSLHYNLMNTMDLNLNEIYHARNKLEGIGLLNVYRKKTEEGKQFIYELNPPSTPKQFFNDGMLNIYLFKKIGKVHFNRLKNFFSDEEMPTNEYEQVTKSFTDIFVSDQQTSLYVSDEGEEELNLEPEKRFIGRQEGKELEGFKEDFNFDLLYSGVKPSQITRKAFTPNVQETIAKLSFLYGIDVLDMQKLVISAADINNEIDIETLRKAARDWYQIESQNQLPTLMDRVQPERNRTQKSEPKTKEEEYIRHLETTSPRERLKQLSGGAEPTKADLQIIEGILFNQKLNPGVVNVLIEYVMLKTDMKLTKAYMEKIASHWTRKKVITVKAAMELAKNEHRQYQEWAKTKKEGKTATRKATRTEVVPEWLNKEKNSEKEKETETETETKLNDQSAERLRKIEESLGILKDRG